MLENYIFCKHECFFKPKYELFKIYKRASIFLDGNFSSQKEINNFIKICKLHEDENGLIKNSFFKRFLTYKGKFVSGPFKNLIFDLIKKNNNDLKISIGNFLVTVSDKFKYIYRPV